MKETIKGLRLNSAVACDPLYISEMYHKGFYEIYVLRIFPKLEWHLFRNSHTEEF